MTLLEWREKYPKCKFCIHKVINGGGNQLRSYCQVKLKFVNENIPRRFCKAFKVNENYNLNDWRKLPILKN